MPPVMCLELARVHTHAALKRVAPDWKLLRLQVDTGSHMAGTYPSTSPVCVPCEFNGYVNSVTDSSCARWCMLHYIRAVE